MALRVARWLQTPRGHAAVRGARFARVGSATAVASFMSDYPASPLGTLPPTPISLPSASWKTYFQTASYFSTSTGSSPRSAILAAYATGSSTQIMLTAPPARSRSSMMYKYRSSASCQTASTSFG